MLKYVNQPRYLLLIIAYLKPMRPKIYNEEIIELCRYQHYSATKIVQLLRRKHPSIGQATVYRTLFFLVSIGLLKKIEGAGPCAYYETSIGTHGHAVDNRTGKIYDFELPKNFLKKLHLPIGFSPSIADIKIYGTTER